jgi:hypothetical protein
MRKWVFMGGVVLVAAAFAARGCDEPLPKRPVRRVAPEETPPPPEFLAAPASPPPVVETPVLLEQAGCMYRPHVFGIQVGQPLVVRNGDDLLHNVHLLPVSNPERNFGQPSFGLEETLRFAAAEVMVPIRCDVHPWMSAWAGVLDHPFFAVTDELGGCATTGLPAGRYVVEVRHERAAPERREIDVPEAGQAEADFLLRLNRDSR